MIGLGKEKAVLVVAEAKAGGLDDAAYCTRGVSAEQAAVRETGVQEGRIECRQATAVAPALYGNYRSAAQSP